MCLLLSLCEQLLLLVCSQLSLMSGPLSLLLLQHQLLLLLYHQLLVSRPESVFASASAAVLRYNWRDLAVASWTCHNPRFE